MSGTYRTDMRVGECPQLATVHDMHAVPEPYAGRQHAVERSSKNPVRINLKSVAEALSEAGMDPTEELIRVLKDPEALDTNTKARLLNELIQYISPKLKAVEVKHSGSLDLPSEQLDKRIQALLEKAVAE